MVCRSGGGACNVMTASLDGPCRQMPKAGTACSKYLLPFEIASVLLLVAMIGAVVMAKKRT